MQRSSTVLGALLALLLALSAIPVFAFGDEPVAEEAVVPMPKLDPEAMTAARIRKEAELAAAEVKIEEELATPAAEAERERSEDAYTQVGASEAVDLLEESFVPALQGLEEDPGRLLSHVEVEKVLSASAVRVSTPEGGREIIEGSTPLTSTLGGEGRKPIDLTLESSGEGFAPANPLTPTSLPGSAEESIGLAGGVQVELPASDDHEAVRIGQMTLFYPETETDTDTVVAPVSGGVEVFEQLRSAESPEDLRFDLDLPPGAALEATGGGAVVTAADGRTLETVPTPTSVDAQGATVPTTMDVEGDSLVVSVSLKESEVAYPVLVDPVIKYEPTNFLEWQGYVSANGGAGYGLQQGASFLRAWSSGSNTYYAPNSFGQYAYSVPGPTAYIANASFWGLSFYPVCGEGQPHGYIGLYNTTYNQWRWLNTITYSGENMGWNTTPWVGDPGTYYAIFGIGTAAAPSQLACVHEFWMGEYSLAEKDETKPVITSVTGVPVEHWIIGQERGTTTVRAIDTGFGVSRITVTSHGASSSTVTPNAGCTGVSGHRCPANEEVPWTTPGPWGEGRRKAEISVEDPAGNVAEYSPGYTEVDLKAPEIELHGQFARATEEVGGISEGARNSANENRLTFPTYQLQINATDGSNLEEATMQSGVAGVKVLLDGKEQPLSWGTQPCAASANSCPLGGTFNLNLVGLTAGVHTLTVVATDRVGHVAERPIEFEYVPATGEGENQVLEHFPLPDGEGGGSEQPEVAVNVMDGNLVFHQQDGEVATTDAGGAIERVYNSQLPQAQSSEFGTGWTMADTPEIEPGAGGAGSGKAIVVQGDGAVETAVPLPTEGGKPTFDPTTHDSIATVGSGYTVTDEGVEAEPPADLTHSGMATALQGSGEATMDLGRAGGELAKISVDDPETSSGAAEQAVTENGEGFLLSAGAVGTLSAPTAVATDTAGDVYVADAGDHKVQKFGAGGAFVRQWGTTGTGEGQFGSIIGIAVGGGNVYVAEAGRIQEFTTAGTFVRQIGAEGTGTGKFLHLAAIAIDGSGNLFALDMPNAAYRVQKFTSAGTYVTNFAIAKGSGSGQVSEPRGLAVDKEGHVWAADSGNSRLVEFSSTGALIRTIGSTGTGPGGLSHPRGVSVDPSGHLWVADTGNSRVQELTSTGAYLARFGEPGTGVGKLSEPSEVALDASGNLWVASSGNNRVEKWTPSEPRPLPPVEPAPSVGVETASGLVGAIKGAPTGSIVYSHEGAFLTSVVGPEAVTHYGKDAAGRLNKIELPNGTKAEITYDSVGRVSVLKIAVEGGATKTTTFEYLSETATAARETVVHRPAVPATHYAIDEFGDVLKWWNAPKPPTLQELDGTLYTERVEVVPTAAVGDKELRVEARSPEGIASIQIVANGNEVVAEKQCEAPKPSECTSLSKIYVTETGDWPPGLVSFEVIAVEANELGSSSTRFAINMPYTPPPTGSELEQPTFEKVQRFREEFGLDLDLKGNERAIVERINNSIAAWDSPGSPEGAVARASAERWGVPLRAADVTELEYREWFYEIDAARIDHWLEETTPNSFSGYYLDQRHGGIMYVGFLGNQTEQLAQLKSSLSLVAGERLQIYPIAPTVSYMTMRAYGESVSSTVEANPTLSELVVSLKETEDGKAVHVGSPNVARVETLLHELLPSVPVAVEYEAGGGSALSGRFRNTGRMRAGDSLFNYVGPGVDFACTAGFGAKERAGEIRGSATWYLFVLTAGHCRISIAARQFYRSSESPFGWSPGNPPNEKLWSSVGSAYRDAFETSQLVRTDAAAIEVTAPDLVPQGIFGEGGNLLPIEPAVTSKIGETLCYSGSRTQVPSCGKVVARSVDWMNEGIGRGGYWVRFPSPAQHGDSGAPVYNVFGHGVGLVTAGRPLPALTETLVEPLLHPPRMGANQVPGILDNPLMGHLSLKVGK